MSLLYVESMSAKSWSPILNWNFFLLLLSFDKITESQFKNNLLSELGSATHARLQSNPKIRPLVPTNQRFGSPVPNFCPALPYRRVFSLLSVSYLMSHIAWAAVTVPSLFPAIPYCGLLSLFPVSVLLSHIVGCCHCSQSLSCCPILWAAVQLVNATRIFATGTGMCLHS